MSRSRAPLTERLDHFQCWFSSPDGTPVFAPEGWQNIALEAKAEIERLQKVLAYLEAEYL